MLEWAEKPFDGVPGGVGRILPVTHRRVGYASTGMGQLGRKVICPIPEGDMELIEDRDWQRRNYPERRGYLYRQLSTCDWIAAHITRVGYTVITGELIVAFPAAVAQGEVKLTDCAGVNGLDPFNKVTQRLAVPPAERIAGDMDIALRRASET